MNLTAADVQHIERQAQARRALTPDPVVAARLRARQQQARIIGRMDKAIKAIKPVDTK